jgi:phytoene/squalene synthetase
VFCEGDTARYEQLASAARSLGAAFQKVNFLRDIKSDYRGMERVYFPGCDLTNFTDGQKQAIEAGIEADFKKAYKGVVQLPVKARFGVYVAYKYYLSLFRKIKRTRPARIMEQRVRIPNYLKAMIIVRAGVRNQLKIM